VHLSTIVIGDTVKPRPAHGSLGLEPEIRDHFATSEQRALPASVWDFPNGSVTKDALVASNSRVVGNLEVIFERPTQQTS
jgi:hypothetical protein